MWPLVSCATSTLEGHCALSPRHALQLLAPVVRGREVRRGPLRRSPFLHEAAHSAFPGQAARVSGVCPACSHSQTQWSRQWRGEGGTEAPTRPRGGGRGTWPRSSGVLRPRSLLSLHPPPSPHSFARLAPFALQKSPSASQAPRVKLKSSPLIEKLQVSAARGRPFPGPRFPTSACRVSPGELTSDNRIALKIEALYPGGGGGRGLKSGPRRACAGAVDSSRWLRNDGPPRRLVGKARYVQEPLPEPPGLSPEAWTQPQSVGVSLARG